MIGTIRHVLKCQNCELEAIAYTKGEAETAAENHLNTHPDHVLHSTVIVEYKNL